MATDATPELDDLVRELSNEVMHVYRWLAEQAGINQSDLMCLTFLRTAGSRATPKGVSEHLGITSGATAIMLNRLEAAGFIERHPHPTDRRGVLLNLGPATRSASLDNVRDYFHKMNRKIIESYSPEELAIIRRFVTDLLRNTRDQLRDTRLNNGLPVIAAPVGSD